MGSLLAPLLTDILDDRFGDVMSMKLIVLSTEYIQSVLNSFHKNIQFT